MRKNNQRRRQLKIANRKINGRYRVYFRVVILSALEAEKPEKDDD